MFSPLTEDKPTLREVHFEVCLNCKESYKEGETILAVYTTDRLIWWHEKKKKNSLSTFYIQCTHPEYWITEKGL